MLRIKPLLIAPLVIFPITLFAFAGYAYFDGDMRTLFVSPFIAATITLPSYLVAVALLWLLLRVFPKLLRSNPLFLIVMCIIIAEAIWALMLPYPGPTQSLVNTSALLAIIGASVGWTFYVLNKREEKKAAQSPPHSAKPE